MKESFLVKIVDILKTFRVWVLIFFLLISYITVFSLHLPVQQDGVVINGIGVNSAAEKAGMSYNKDLSLKSLEQVTYLDSTPIRNSDDFYNYVSSLSLGSSVIVKTNQNSQGYNVLLADDGTNRSAVEVLGISVRDTPFSNIRLGIELEGGSRLVLQPKGNLTDTEFDSLIQILQNRLDIYGASGTKVNKLDDAFSGEKFIIVESTSSNKNDILELIRRQGKFEAKLGNVTVITGDDILKVFTDPQHAHIQSCSESQEGHICSYVFQVEINSESAQKMLDEAQKLDISNGYLTEKLYFYLDGTEMTSLNVASSFKYQKVTTPSITISGKNQPTVEKAKTSVNREFEFTKALLLTQSLPTELEIVQSYSISSSLGEELLQNAFLVGLLALFLVASVIALRYRKIGIFIGIMIALFGELIIVFGIVSLLKFTIDLAAIGGLIAAIGTGVDDQVIITDEYFRDRDKYMSSKKKIKGAFYIIFISYCTTVAAMVPLGFAGLKMLQGFAAMIIIGVSVGVLITRPAYAAMLRVMMTTREERSAEKDDDD